MLSWAGASDQCGIDPSPEVLDSSARMICLSAGRFIIMLFAALIGFSDPVGASPSRKRGALGVGGTGAGKCAASLARASGPSSWKSTRVVTVQPSGTKVDSVPG